MENQKYLLNGQAVHVVEQLSTGFLVENIYTDNSDEENEFIGSDKPYFVDAVFDNAPTEKLDKQVAILNEKIAELTAKRNEVQKEVWASEKTLTERKSLFKNYNDPAIALLENYLEKKITHFVLKHYSGVSIHERKKVFHYESEMQIYFSMSLNSNKIEYKTYAKVCDNDRNDYVCYPCCSYEEAHLIAGKVFEEIWNERSGSYKENFIRSAEKLNIPIPDFYIQNIKDEKIKSIERNIKDYEEKLIKERKALMDINKLP